MSDDSDVYVYCCGIAGLVCCNCPFKQDPRMPDFATEDWQEMIDHLEDHRHFRHLVPERVFTRLKKELNEQKKNRQTKKQRRQGRNF